MKMPDAISDIAIWWCCAPFIYKLFFVSLVAVLLYLMAMISSILE